MCALAPQWVQYSQQPLEDTVVSGEAASHIFLMSDRRVNLQTADKDKSTSVRLAWCRAEQGIVGATSHTLIIGKGKQSETSL